MSKNTDSFNLGGGEDMSLIGDKNSSILSLPNTILVMDSPLITNARIDMHTDIFEHESGFGRRIVRPLKSYMDVTLTMRVPNGKIIQGSNPAYSILEQFSIRELLKEVNRRLKER